MPIPDDLVFSIRSYGSTMTEKHFLQIIYEVADPSSMISMSLPPPSNNLFDISLKLYACINHFARPPAYFLLFGWAGGNGIMEYFSDFPKYPNFSLATKNFYGTSSEEKEIK